MHICATNICVWIRTLVLESLKEITLYNQGRGPNPEDGAILENIRTHSQRHAGLVLGTHYGPETDWEPLNLNIRGNSHELLEQDHKPGNILSRMVHTTTRAAIEAFTTVANVETTTTSAPYRMPVTTSTSTSTTTEEPTTYTPWGKIKKFISSTTSTTILPSTVEPSTADRYETTTTSSPIADIFSTFASSTPTPTPSTTTQESIFNNIFGAMENAYQHSGLAHNDTSPNDRTFENFDSLMPEALIATASSANNSCGKNNIMGTIVQDSAPYLYPFIIEYSLIGAVVIYVMWKHIGRYPKYVHNDQRKITAVVLTFSSILLFLFLDSLKKIWNTVWK